MKREKINFNTETERLQIVNYVKESGRFVIEEALLENEKYLIVDTEPLTGTPIEPTQDDYLVELDFRVSLIELGL